MVHHQVLKDKIKEKLIIIPNIEEEGIFPNIFYEGSINLIHKPQEDENKWNKNIRPTLLMKS